MQKIARCRGCGRELKGKPYYTGGLAYIPETNERARVNFYGGWVCSRQCDEKVCFEMGSSFPGAGPLKRLTGDVYRSVKDNWIDE